MQRVSQDEPPIVDFWPYVEAIPEADFNEHNCSEGTVRYVYRHPLGRWEHVLIDSETENVFMAIILDRETASVAGHRLLDFSDMYGVS